MDEVDSHLLNLDNLLLRTICFVPEERTPIHFFKFIPLYTDTRTLSDNLLPLLQPVADEQEHYLVVPKVSTIKSPGELTLLDEKPLGATGRTNKFKQRDGYAGT